MYTLFINGFEATTKLTLEEAAKEGRMIKDGHINAIVQVGWDGHVFSVEDAEAFIARVDQAYETVQQRREATS